MSHSHSSADSRWGSLIDVKVIRGLSKRSLPISLFIILFQWSAIGLAITAAVWSDHMVVYFASVCVIASRQHALIVIMHDAAHGSLCNNRAVNDFVSNVFCAFPIFVGTQTYRAHHNTHHLYLNTDKDPDFEPKANNRVRRTWVLKFFGEICGLGIVSSIRSVLAMQPTKKEKSPDRRFSPEQIGFFAFTLGLGASVVWWGLFLEYFQYWLVPLGTVFTAVFRFRSAAEHVGCDEHEKLAATRTVIPSIVERWLFAPCNVNYHLDHHLYPSVPLHRLPTLHKMLERNLTYQEHAHVTRGYVLGRESALVEMSMDGQAKPRRQSQVPERSDRSRNE